MKKTLFGVFTLVIFVLTFTLSSVSSKEIPIDNTLEVGKFENGLSYYIKENSFKKEKASLRLLIKAGSGLETEEERGIAHFLEHMVFRGSENFKDFEMIKYLESIGAQFGPDTNAYTSFDRTEYMLEVPIKNIKDLDKALLFLSDIAFRANLEEEKIDKERNIVLDELRRSLGPNMRANDKHFKALLKDTTYEDRLPIGKEDVIKNCSPDIIRNFYKKWYQPQNMAVIAVGDFDKTEVQKTIEKHFSKKTNDTEILPKYVVNKNKETTFSIVRDPEISYSIIELILRKNTLPTQTKKDINNGIIFSIIYDILNERFLEMAAKSDSDFISAWTSSTSFITNLHIKEMGVMCWEDQKLLGFEKALIELKKMQNGITKDEFERAIKSRKQSISEKLSNLDKIENSEYTSMCSNHFINEDAIFSKESLLKYKDKFLSKLTFEEIDQETKDWGFENFLSKNFIILATLPNDSTLLESDITSSIENVKNLEIIEEEKVVLDEKYLIEPKFEIEGKILKVEKDEDLNITKVLFENGLKVYLKPTDLKNDEILIRSYALSGIANLDNKILDSAKIASSYFYDSGISGIEKSSFSKILDSKNSSLNLGIEFNKRDISSNTTKDSFEDITKLINRIFTSKNNQDEMFEKTIKMEKENQKFSNLYPDSIYYKKANLIFTSQNELFKDINLDLVNLNEVKDVLDTFFSNPKDFTFFIVGDFEVDKILPILEKNLGSISSDKLSRVEIKDLKKIEFSKNDSTEIIKAGSDDKSMCILGFELDKMDAKILKNWTKLNLLKTILNTKLLDALRIENGKTYSPYSFPSYYLYPDLSSFNYFISFTGPQSEIFNINDLAINTTKSLIETGPSLDELNVAKEIAKTNLKENAKYNSFEMAKMYSSHILTNGNPNEFKDMLKLEEEDLIDSVTVEEISDFIKSIFSKDKLTSVVWLPEEK
ncbi:MAG: putative zinc protease [Candidatus Anoxychlamydiales bacterium]|nr:putative zinc protease [Candidatus Anoxychlamydiales bacterium]